MAPEPSFVSNFKQALLEDGHNCTRSEKRSYFDFGEGTHGAQVLSNDSTACEDPAFDGINEIEGKQSSISYPLSLFADFPSLPNGEELNHILQCYQQIFVVGTPFFASLSAPVTPTPPYLIVPRALMGAAVSEDVNEASWAEALQRAAFSLLCGSLEVDNSLARKPEWIQAVSSVSLDNYPTSTQSDISVILSMFVTPRFSVHLVDSLLRLLYTFSTAHLQHIRRLGSECSRVLAGSIRYELDIWLAILLINVDGAYS